MKIFNQNQDDILFHLNKLLEDRIEKNSNEIDNIVYNIIEDVRVNGDDALIKYTKKFDNNLINKSQILISNEIKKNKKIKINNKIMKSFHLAIENITEFHKKQLPKNYKLNKKDSLTGLFWKPINSVGLYVPGGKASYPSSLLMNLIPAKIAGVKRIVVMTPCKNGYLNPYIIALLDILGISR